MNYQQMAEQLLNSSFLLYSSRTQKNFIKAMQGEPFLLQCLADYQKELIPSTVSNLLGVSAARVAATLNSLEKKGLIHRRIDQDDRRRIIIELTEAGQEQARKNRQLMLDEASALLELLGEQDAREYVRISQKLAQLGILDMK